MKKSVIAALAVLILSGLALKAVWAQDMGPALIYSPSGKFDKSFNEMSYVGAEKYKQDTGKDYREFETQTETQVGQAIQNFASRGFSPIVMISNGYRDQLERVARDFPDTKFMMIDAFIDLPNVRSVEFSEHEGSYLVGLVAGMTSKTKTVGFVGGQDIPLIREFACGYAQGAIAGGAKDVIRTMTGTTSAAFNDPVKGGEIARSQMEQGADVIFAAAGGTGIGVLQAVVDGGKLAIGVDSNQNYMYPGSILTSMVKRVDIAVYDTFRDATEGNWSGGSVQFGTAQRGVDWALDEHNRDLITPEVEAAVNEARQKIIDGEITVFDYTTGEACPV